MKTVLLRVEFRVLPAGEGETDLVKMVPAVLRVPVDDDEAAIVRIGSKQMVTVEGTVQAVLPG